MLICPNCGYRWELGICPHGGAAAVNLCPPGGVNPAMAVAPGTGMVIYPTAACAPLGVGNWTVVGV
jgi:hypothetical protein